jgi:UDPglucose 6-dehydrogenase
MVYIRFGRHDMKKIGIIGQGFVGTAVKEGMKNFFDVRTYDINGNCNETSLENLILNVNETFLCLPTPMHSSGQCDLSIVKNCLMQISTIVSFHNKKNFIVIIKSTIPPGTTEQLNREYPAFNTAFNPEFLTEANANEDFKNQNRIIIGADKACSSRVRQIFVKAFPKVPIIKTSSTIAETIKYVTNTFLAMKVSYANEIYQLCEKLGVDYDKVIEYARYDDRLGNSHWSVPGPDGDFGFGGHCFPKDLAALAYIANQLDVDRTMLVAAMTKNILVRTDFDWTRQIGRAVSKEDTNQ